jgi:signal transduction histidine kinase/DNA-binding NarL/FixJ family response regulator
MRVLIVTSDAQWQERTHSILRQAGWEVGVTAPPALDADGKITLLHAARGVDAILVHVTAGDPLPAIASLWRTHSAMPVLLLGDEIHAELRSAAVASGVAHVGRAAPTPEELVAAVTLACDHARVGSPELVRAMCRAMCSLSASAASANDPCFLSTASQEISALFSAPIVSIMLRRRRESCRARQDGVAWRVLRGGAPRIILRGADREDELSGATPRADVAASMCVPIPGGAGEEPRGVINVARTDAYAVFVPRDLEICASLAALIAESLDAIAARTSAAELRDRIAAVERLSTVGEMAAGIAHEVANPIASVCANVHHIIETMGVLAPVLGSIQADADTEERLDELPVLLAETWEGLERATAVIKQMRALVRVNATAVSREDCVDLRMIAENTVRLLRSRLGDAVKVEVEREVTVRGSVVELSQALINLAVNAGDACEERRGHEPGFRSRIVIRAREEGGQGVLEVSDNGAGIPPALLRRIFSPLFTTKAADRGTGLGLAIVRRVVDSHHGKVSVSSVVGEGTTFRILVPLAEDAGVAPYSLRAG